jgi:hypothetical protein
MVAATVKQIFKKKNEAIFIVKIKEEKKRNGCRD